MRFDQGGLLEALHEGVFQTPLWGDFLERLRASTGSLYTSLLFRRFEGESNVELYAGGEPQPETRRKFLEKYQKITDPYEFMRNGRVYSQSEVINVDDPWQKAFYDEILRPEGLTSLRIMRVTEESGVSAWLTCAGAKEFSAETSALISALGPHLRIALRTLIGLERERFRSSVSSDAIDRLDAGWITLDAQCRILDMTRHVEQLFQRTDVLRRGRYNRLTPKSPSVDRELTQLVKQYSASGEAAPKAINLSRDPWMDMVVAPVQRNALSAGAAPVAIVYVRGDRRSEADRRDQLVDLFGLLPSEARLAWILAQGVSIADAAAAAGLSLETARNYSKRIYAKTGARGQPELVRIILTSVLTLT